MTMNLDVKQILSATVVLFAIIDILGAIPIILNIRKKGIKINSLVVSTFALVILMLFLFFGDFILQLFNVDIESFAVAGSLVIFVFALEMLLDIEIFRNNGPAGSASFIPIAFPLVAGPGSFTTLLSLRAEYYVENIVIALVLNLLFVYLVLSFTSKIEKAIGESGIYVLRKFFGIILLAIAVKLFVTNIGHLI
ncbi:MAG: MarC family protein [Paludibacteraceae bacterium]|nr:MarC family protein [Paludibacteraceae bacterium]MBR5469143.1 MarC family protein [Paludibacteraceae bacterium]